MVIEAHPKAHRGPAQPRPELRLTESRRRRLQPHLFTYLVGNALAWTLWGALSISADGWYWWPLVPFTGWTLVLTLHLRHIYRSAHG
ncbi:MAG TPA: 2TM domain-containing protein [Gaiellaceae bacterium]|jgi:hypothetical protein|nr:2TM domain-containing protein [Gaiellaceae bacterium]